MSLRLLLVLGLLGKFADHQLGHGGLIFYNVRAAFFSNAGHLLGHFQTAVVVDPGLGYDRYRHR